MSDAQEAVKRLGKSATATLSDMFGPDTVGVSQADLRIVLNALAAVTRERDEANEQLGAAGRRLHEVLTKQDELHASLRTATEGWTDALREVDMLKTEIQWARYWEARSDRWREQCRRRREQVRRLTQERDELDELAGERYRSRKALHAELRAEKAAHEKTLANMDWAIETQKAALQSQERVCLEAREWKARAEAAERERDEVNEQLLRAQLEAVQGVEVSPEEFEKLKEAFSKDAKPNAALRAAFIAATGNHKP
jgi:chromosome segregation ATPase